MATRLETLLATGELQRAAAREDVRTQADLARAIGLSRNAYEKCKARILKRGRPFPSFDELKRAGAMYRDLDTNIENSIPDQGQAVPGTKWPNVAAFDAGLEVPAAGHSVPRTLADDLAERRHRSEVASLKARLREAMDKLEQCQYELATAVAANDALHVVEPIRPRERTSGLREATAVALASDWHIEETVDAEAVNGVNRYDLTIARRRVERYFESVPYLTNYHRGHFQIRDMVLWLGGDLITGYLREEDLESNSLSPTQAIATLHSWIVEGIRSVLARTEGIETLRVVCNSGNHGRLTKKVQPRTREANSIEWLMYQMLAREFADDPRVRFILPHGVHTYLQIYDMVVRFTHGDATKYGGGIGGIMIPIRKAIARWETVRHADLNIMGHYHSKHFLRDLIVNGSLIGYNEFALDIAAPFEEPQQCFFLVDKVRGVTMPADIWPEERLVAA